MSQAAGQASPHLRRKAPSTKQPRRRFTFRTDQNKVQSSTSARNCCVTTANNNRLTTPCCNIQLLSIFGKPVQLKPSVSILLCVFLFDQVWNEKASCHTRCFDPKSIFETLMVIWRVGCGRNKWCLLPLVGG